MVRTIHTGRPATVTQTAREELVREWEVRNKWTDVLTLPEPETHKHGGLMLDHVEPAIFPLFENTLTRKDHPCVNHPIRDREREVNTRLREAKTIPTSTPKAPDTPSTKSA